VDLLLHNGQVHTLDHRLAIAQAVAVTGSRIVAVGSDEELAPLAGPGVKTINLGGRVVTPGFIDSHIQMIDMALLRRGVDLAGASSLEEALQRVRAVAVRTSPDDWVMGWGWNQYLWPEPSLPDKARLDAICPDKPVLLKRVDGH
jgi:predicted amidohydrolase YtcJ